MSRSRTVTATICLLCASAVRGSHFIRVCHRQNVRFCELHELVEDCTSVTWVDIEHEPLTHAHTRPFSQVCENYITRHLFGTRTNPSNIPNQTDEQLQSESMMMLERDSFIEWRYRILFSIQFGWLLLLTKRFCLFHLFHVIFFCSLVGSIISSMGIVCLTSAHLLLP